LPSNVSKALPKETLSVTSEATKRTTKKQNDDEEEDRLASMLRSVSSEDEVYFDNSSFLE
jgi:hypothetical protein